MIYMRLMGLLAQSTVEKGFIEKEFVAFPDHVSPHTNGWPLVSGCISRVSKIKKDIRQTSLGLNSPQDIDLQKTNRLYIADMCDGDLIDSICCSFLSQSCTDVSEYPAQIIPVPAISDLVKFWDSCIVLFFQFDFPLVWTSSKRRVDVQGSNASARMSWTH